MRMHFEPTEFSVKKKEKRVSRTYMNLGGGLNRPRASETDPTVFLHWTTTPLPYDLDLTGPIELRLDAACSAPDTAFIAVFKGAGRKREGYQCHVRIASSPCASQMHSN